MCSRSFEPEIGDDSGSALRKKLQLPELSLAIESLIKAGGLGKVATLWTFGFGALAALVRFAGFLAGVALSSGTREVEIDLRGAGLFAVVFLAGAIGSDFFSVATGLPLSSMGMLRVGNKL